MSQEFERQHFSTDATTTGGLSGFRQEAVSAQPVGKAAETDTARVIHGCRDRRLPIVGQSVGSQREGLRSYFNFDESATALINGEEVAEDYVIQKDDILEFLKIAGDKGGLPIADIKQGNLDRWNNFTAEERTEIQSSLQMVYDYSELQDTNLKLREEIETLEQGLLKRSHGKLRGEPPGRIADHEGQC